METRIAGHDTLLSLCLGCVIAETLTLEKQIREVIEYHKYFIFSLSAMEYDNEGVLGIGVFGKVWIVR